jgi:Peroxisomal membrane protein (Pex16)
MCLSVLVHHHYYFVQKAELSRRKAQWFFYLLRSPAFELLLGPAAHGTASAFEGVPLLGGAANYALQMLLYVQKHHFYISAS